MTCGRLPTKVVVSAVHICTTPSHGPFCCHSPLICSSTTGRKSLNALLVLSEPPAEFERAELKKLHKVLRKFNWEACSQVWRFPP
jgi:hypothetical protein